ncbi:hypothetical protein VKT23_014042 [Stygiomarasmius scandens]|uniref:Uncharacterized protein n=1 Tax=Marasmiellus scandens TaxID=2682957 RepID=A0ABR1J1U5_9AGAR
MLALQQRLPRRDARPSSNRMHTFSLDAAELKKAVEVVQEKLPQQKIRSLITTLEDVGRVGYRRTSPSGAPSTDTQTPLRTSNGGVLYAALVRGIRASLS